MDYNNIYQQLQSLQPNAELDIPARQNLLQRQFGTQPGNANANYQRIPQTQPEQQQLLLQQQQQQLLQQQQEAQRQQQAASQQAEAAPAKNKPSRDGKSVQNSATQPAPAPIPVPAAQPAATSSPKSPAEVILPDTALAVAQLQLANIPADKTEKTRTHSHYEIKLCKDSVALAQYVQQFPNRMVENLPANRLQRGSQTTSSTKKRRRGNEREESDSDSDYAAPAAGDVSPSGASDKLVDRNLSPPDQGKATKKFISGGEEAKSPAAAAERNDDAVEFVVDGGNSSQNEAMVVDGDATATKASESEKQAEPNSSDLARALDHINDDEQNISIVARKASPCWGNSVPSTFLKEPAVVRVPPIVYRRIRRPIAETDSYLDDAAENDADNILTGYLWVHVERSCEASTIRAQNHFTRIAAARAHAYMNGIAVKTNDDDQMSCGGGESGSVCLLSNTVDVTTTLRTLLKTKPTTSGRLSAAAEDLNHVVQTRDWLKLHRALCSSSSYGFNTALTNCTADGLYPVHVAAQNDDVISMALLLAHGANVASCSKNEQSTPFLMAAERGNLAMLMFVISTVKSSMHRSEEPARRNSTLFPGVSLALGKLHASENELINLFANRDISNSNVFHFLLAHQTVEPLMYVLAEMRCARYDPMALLYESNELGQTPLQIALTSSPFTNAESERAFGATLDRSKDGRCHLNGLTVLEALRYELGIDLAAVQRAGKFCGAGTFSCAQSPVDDVEPSEENATNTIAQSVTVSNYVTSQTLKLKLPVNEAVRRKLAYTVQHLVEIGCDPLERENSPSKRKNSAALITVVSRRRSSRRAAAVNSKASLVDDGCNAFNAALLDCGSFETMRALFLPILYADCRVRWSSFAYIFPDTVREICAYTTATYACLSKPPPLWSDLPGVVAAPRKSARHASLLDHAHRLRSRVWAQRDEQIILPDITHNHAPRPIRAFNSVDTSLYPEDARYLPQNCKRFANAVGFNTHPGATCQCTLHGCSTYTCNCAGLARRDQFCVNGRVPGIAKQTHSAFAYECSVLCRCHTRQCRNRQAQLMRGDVNVRLELFKTRRKGWGVRTLQPIRAGHLVAIMAGMYHDYWDAASNGKYSLTLTSALPDFRLVAKRYVDECYASDFVLECLVAGNIGRYFNHSCAPNCEMLPFYNADDASGQVPSHTSLPSMVIVAMQNVKSYNELTWYYSEDYWLSGDFGECRCGAPTCVSRQRRKKSTKQQSDSRRLIEKRGGNERKRKFFDTDNHLQQQQHRAKNAANIYADVEEDVHLRATAEDDADSKSSFQNEGDDEMSSFQPIFFADA